MSAEALCQRKWIRIEPYHDYKNFALAFSADKETQVPEAECIEGAVIIQEGNLANDTFYKNKEHIACLFKDHEFSLDAGGSLPFNLNPDQPGTVYAFVEGIPGGGLDLGQIRSLSQAILDKECSKYGRVIANYFSGNVS
ncbi:hypothetical protein DL769_004689 [Monosporascus sp. CRB-8-3]|nr:hypothetical protein DL769_004689 [Monosporascus sp. CRB-8-3]